MGRPKGNPFKSSIREINGDQSHISDFLKGEKALMRLPRLKIRKHTVNIVGLLFSTFMFMWAIWQHDLVAVAPMQSWGDQPFVIGFHVVMDRWTAYDFTLSMIVVAYVLLFVSLWLWND